jgi:hypothetical protein
MLDYREDNGRIVFRWCGLIKAYLEVNDDDDEIFMYFF